MSPEDLGRSLLALDERDGLGAAVQEGGLLGLCARLGIEVAVNFGAYARERRATLTFSRPPRIDLFRDAAPRRPIHLAPRDEGRLKSHERFSVAHEIGHFLALRELGVEPVVPTAERRSEYWKHEGAINRFASRLLLPAARLDGMLAAAPRGAHLPVRLLMRWAREVRLSRIALAGRVAERREDFGYLELEFRRDPKLPRLLLVVREWAASPDLDLPRAASKVRNDRLVSVLQQGLRGTRHLPGVSFDGKRIQSLHLSWDHVMGKAGEADSGEASWVGRLVSTCWSRGAP